MTAVEVHRLEIAELREDELARFELKAYPSRSGYALDVEGWAEGRTDRVDAVDLTIGGSTVRRIALNKQMRDEGDDGPVIGFYSQVNTLAFPREFDLGISVVFESGKSVEMGRLQGSRPELRIATDEQIEPLMITTIGRSGSTPLLRALAGHPEIVAYPPHDPTARVATYWVDAFHSLVEPASYMRQLFPNDLRRNWFLGDAEAPPPLAEDPPTRDWLAGDAVDEIASACRRRAGSFYGELARREGREGARYFVEKVEPGTAEQVREMFPGAREVVLVRDFRDMVAAMISHGQGRQLWSPSPGATWADHIEKLGEAADVLHAGWIRRRDRSHLVRYEDLASSPRPTIEALLVYVELEARGSEVDAMTAAFTPDLSASIGRWREDLQPALARVAERAFAPALSGFGYE